MRFIELRLSPAGGFHFFDRVVSNEPAVNREAIHRMTLLDDGTALTIYELSGDPERINLVVEEHFGAIAYQFSRLEENSLIYAHIKPNETVAKLLRIPRTHQLIIDTPMYFTNDGALRVTLVGADEALREALPEIPEHVSHTITEIGDYQPDRERLFSMLSERQQETLKAAVQLGYYRDPRQATYKDIAAALDRSDGTIGEHLRKAENTILSGVVP